MKRIRLGISPCPNDVFLFSGILLNRVDNQGYDFDVVYEDVENLNRRAQNGDLDVIKISYANYVRCAVTYELLASGGALGRGCGPLLLSHGGGWDETAEVLVPGEFTTANFLLDYYWAKNTVCKRFLPFDTLYEEMRRTPGTQGVVIHEKRFTYEQDGLTLIQDLGQYWEETTGFAIPLGAIAARRTLGLKETMEALIRESLRWAEANRPEALSLCQQHAQDLNERVIEAHIALYVNDYSRNLDAKGQAAVDFFLQRQREFLAHKNEKAAR